MIRAEALEKTIIDAFNCAHEAEVRLIKIVEEIEKLEKLLQISRLRTTREIISARDEHGKQLYTNDKARETAIELKLLEDKHYNELLAAYEEAMHTKRELEVEVRHQKMRLKAAELVTMLITGKESE